MIFSIMHGSMGKQNPTIENQSPNVTIILGFDMQELRIKKRKDYRKKSTKTIMKNENPVILQTNAKP